MDKLKELDELREICLDVHKLELYPNFPSPPSGSTAVLDEDVVFAVFHPGTAGVEGGKTERVLVVPQRKALLFPRAGAHFPPFSAIPVSDGRGAAGGGIAGILSREGLALRGEAAEGGGRRGEVLDVWEVSPPGFPEPYAAVELRDSMLPGYLSPEPPTPAAAAAATTTLHYDSPLATLQFTPCGLWASRVYTAEVYGGLANDGDVTAAAAALTCEALTCGFEVWSTLSGKCCLKIPTVYPLNCSTTTIQGWLNRREALANLTYQLPLLLNHPLGYISPLGGEGTCGGGLVPGDYFKTRGDEGLRGFGGLRVEGGLGVEGGEVRGGDGGEGGEEKSKNSKKEKKKKQGKSFKVYSAVMRKGR